MVGYPLKNTLSEHGSVNRGICQTGEGNLLSDVEEVVDISRGDDGQVSGTRIDGSTLVIDEASPVSMNFWGFTAAYLEQLESHFIQFLKDHGTEMKSECYIPTVVDELIRDQRADCVVLETSASWFGVTYPDDKPHVVESIAALVTAGDYPTPLA